ncbi:hypothetical protein ACPXBB_25980, partial [Escherichia coli]|uniref:hypothetical protein n=1 Tax=Escherichia coli TaxID=562 RepID=UPI003CEA9124
RTGDLLMLRLQECGREKKAGSGCAGAAKSRVPDGAAARGCGGDRRLRCLPCHEPHGREKPRECRRVGAAQL